MPVPDAHLAFGSDYDRTGHPEVDAAQARTGSRATGGAAPRY